jgi:flagellar basal-body rod protein FlgF
MDKGIYTALSGGIAKTHDLELIANNLANANTPGFKRDNGTFNEYLTELRKHDSAAGLDREISALTIENPRPQGDKSFVEMDGVYTDFRQGGVQRTGRDLDIALEGKGFFEVLTPSGIRYTRQGNFNISKDGKLVTPNGYPVLLKPNKGQGTQQLAFGMIGVKGAAVKPVPVRDPSPQERIIQLGEGPIQITSDGHIVQNGAKISQLNIEEFHEQQWLEKVGNSYFRNVDPENLKNTPTETKLHQGFLEGSNVNPVTEMTRLIEATRAYESHMQAVKTYQDIDGKTVNDIAGVR